jgi:ankyrin repeat protein
LILSVHRFYFAQEAMALTQGKMVGLWLLVLAAAPAGAMAGDELNDFSNNLATDLGPLLALFGEAMTKQYLSESTSFLDYFIFALAPIGIMTAIVSAIRVCGSTALRAFIGRAQEGEGTVEAELCTSTGRDVCELFSNPGIARVLGRPKILELVKIRDDSADDWEHTGIHLFRYHLYKSSHAGGEWVKRTDISLWQRLKDLVKRRQQVSPPSDSSEEDTQDVEKPVWTEQTQELPSEFLTSPNLSLNIGIVKLKWYYFFAAAFLGIALQGGVLVMAGVLALDLGWTRFSTTPTPTTEDIVKVVMDNPSPILYMAGTAVLCVGMFCCASLIGQSTQEDYYQRRAGWDSKPSRLFWLQPGNQVVGDQTFDAFAYAEDTNNPRKRISEYTSSHKHRLRRSKIYTPLAITLTLAGYIVQFVGLRGMTPYVSIAHLGVTIIMSIVRGSLRIGRLQREDNKLGGVPDKVVGHELDWLSFEIGKDGEDGEPPLWHFTGNTSTCESDGPESCALETSKSPHSKLLRYRARLANLTGHQPFQTLDPLSYQEWRDDQVAIRSKAKSLATALSAAAETLLGRIEGANPVCLHLEIGMSGPPGNDPRAGHVRIVLEPPEDSSLRGWTVDSSEIEAVLGLWLWSLKTHSWTEEVPRARILSGRDTSAGTDNAAILRGELDLWLGRSTVNVSDLTLATPEDHLPGSQTLWRYDADLDAWRPWPSSADIGDDRKKLLRFSGWNSVPGYRGSSSSSNESPVGYKKLPRTPSQLEPVDRAISVQYVKSENSILSECCQELYSALISAMVDSKCAPDVGEVAIEEASGQLRWTHGKVSDMATSFAENGVGSYVDGLLSVVQSLRRALKLPDGRDVLFSILQAAARYRKSNKWRRAENLLRWQCEHYAPLVSQSDDGGDNFLTAITALGELYREAAANIDPGKRKFGYSGLQWMLQSYSMDNLPIMPAYNRVKDVLDRYHGVILALARNGQEAHHFGVTPDVQVQAQRPTTIESHRRVDSQAQAPDMTTEIPPNSNISGSDTASIESLPKRVGVRVQALAAATEKPPNDLNDNTQNMAAAELPPNNVQVRVQVPTPMEFPLPPNNSNNHIQVQVTAEKTQRPPSGHSQVKISATTELPPSSVDILQAITLGERTTALQALSCLATEKLPASELCESFILAAGKGWDEILAALLDVGIPVDHQDSSGRTALSHSAEAGHRIAMKVLLQHGASPDLCDEDQRSPLSWAAQNGHTEVISLLLDTEGVDPSSADVKGLIPLSWAAASGHLEAVKLLVERKPNTMVLSQAKNVPIVEAATNGHLGVVEYLLAQDMTDIYTPCRGTYLLHHAVKLASVEFTSMLLKVPGIAVDMQDEKTQLTALMMAVQDGNFEIVKLLIENGNAQTVTYPPGKTQSALSIAVERGHKEIVTYLLEEGKSRPEESNEQGSTALHLAVSQGDLGLVKLLVKPGTRFRIADLWDEKRRTPLHLAAMHCQQTDGLKILKLLLKQDEDMAEERDEGLERPLHYAIEAGSLEAVRALVEIKDATLEAWTDSGHNELSLALELGHMDIVELLLATKLAHATKEFTEYNSVDTPPVAQETCAEGSQLILDGGNVREQLTDPERRSRVLAAAKGAGYQLFVRALFAPDKAAVANSGTNAADSDAESDAYAYADADYGDEYDDDPSEEVGAKRVLAWAASKGNPAILGLLLTAPYPGIGDQDSNGDTPLHIAVRRGHKEAVTMLLGAETYPARMSNKEGLTPLMWAAKYADKIDLAVVQTMLASGSGNVYEDDTGEEYRTPLSLAAEEGHVEMVKLLLENEASPYMTDDKGYTPLSLAVQRAHANVVRVLLDHDQGCADDADYKGRSPLSWAAQGGNVDIVKMLLDITSDVDACDEDSRTPLSWAAEHGHLAVVMMLLDMGGADAGWTDSRGRTALAWARKKGHTDVASYLQGRAPETPQTSEV